MIADAPLAVMPVLVGPLQILLALLPAILAAVGGGILAAFKPSGFKRIVRFFWHQKLFTACLIAIGVALWHGYPQKLWSGSRAGGAVTDAARAGAWPLFRGGTDRTGYAGGDEPTAPANVWEWTGHETVYSSPTVAGGRVYFTTVTGMGPFTPEGKGAVVCVDAESGKELWRYAPDDFRGTFSSPAVAEERVVVGEGLHSTADARVTCLDLSGRKVWDFRTKSHVEATPCIHNGRVYVAAAGDGFYCLRLAPAAEGLSQVAWHLPGEKYVDCESSPVTDGETVWFGLGDGGNAVVAVDAATGDEKWRTPTPQPVFAPPTLVDGKLYIATGNGDFMRSAEDLRAAKLESLKEDGATAAQLEEAAKKFAPFGELWRLDEATGAVEWRVPTGEVVLGAIAHRDGHLTAASRSGELLRITTNGEVAARWNAGSPLLASPAVGPANTYAATRDGRLVCLKSETLQPVWDMPLQQEGTLTSSPAIANGHAFIGTEGQGLRCVGTTEPPEPFVWANGERGGIVDGSVVPDQAEVDWTYIPPELNRSKLPDARFHVTTPLTTDGESLYVIAETGTDGILKDERSHLMRLKLSNVDGTPPSLEWRVAARHRVARPLAIRGGPRDEVWDHAERVAAYGLSPRLSGDFLIYVDDSDAPTSSRTVTCRHREDGRQLWTWRDSVLEPSDDEVTLGSTPLIIEFDDRGAEHCGCTVDQTRCYVSSAPHRLVCLELQTGARVWSRTFQGNETRTGLFEAEGILIVALDELLLALDAPTGRLLWQRKLSDLFKSSISRMDMIGPVVFGRLIALSTESSAVILRVLDGKIQWKWDRGSLRANRLLMDSTHVLIGTDGCFVERLSDGAEVMQLSPMLAVDLDRNGEHEPGLQSWYQFPSLMGSTVLVLGKSEIKSYDIASNQSRVWATDNRLKHAVTPALLIGGRVYFATRDYGIVCLRGVQP